MNQQAAATGDHERYSRRLSDKIQAAFEHACDEGELIAASELLAVLENVLLSNPLRPERRESVVAPLLALHERLWNLRMSSRGEVEAEPEAVLGE